MNSNRAMRHLGWLRLAGLAGVVATGLVSGWERFWVNWIIWFLFILTIGLGSLFMVALEHVVGARWSVPLRRVPERLSGLVTADGPGGAPGAALPAAPVSVGAAGGSAGSGHCRQGRLAQCAVLCRCAWCSASASGFSPTGSSCGGSFRQDRKQDPRFNVRARRFAPVFMIIFGITITIVAFDWISSLEPAWYSDVFGVYVFAGTFLAGLAATTLVVLYLHGPRAPPRSQARSSCITWAVFSSPSPCSGPTSVSRNICSCGMRICRKRCSGTRMRLEGLWGTLVLALAVLHFLVPFLVLVPRTAKRDARRLFWVAAIMLIAHWLDLYWMIYPGARHGAALRMAGTVLCGLFPVGGIPLDWLGARPAAPTCPSAIRFLREGLEFHL